MAASSRTQAYDRVDATLDAFYTSDASMQACLDRARTLVARLGDQSMLSAVDCDLAQVYRSLRAWDLSLGHGHRALEEAERGGDTHSQAVAFESLGITYLEKEELAPAVDYLAKALDLSLATVGDRPLQEACSLAESLVRAHLLREDVESARSVCERIPAIAAEARMPFAEGICRLAEVSLSRALGDLSRAELKLKEAEAAFEGFMKLHPKAAERSSWKAHLQLERGFLLRARGRSGP